MICYDSYVRTLKHKSVRRGFTLVELLIVIVVIGILSAMMIISATEVMASAKANNIIVALRQWKTATIAWYTEHLDDVTDGWNGTKQRFADHVKAKDLVYYLGDNGLKVSGNNVVDNSGGTYMTDHITGGQKNLQGNKTGGIWLIAYKLPADNSRVKAKLEARAKSVGLFWKKGANYGFYTAEDAKAAGGDEVNRVYIQVMEFEL